MNRGTITYKCNFWEEHANKENTGGHGTPGNIFMIFGEQENKQIYFMGSCTPSPPRGSLDCQWIIRPRYRYKHFIVPFDIGWAVEWSMECTDPGIFVRGWGGGSRPDGENTALKTLLLFCAFLVLNLFYSSQRGSNGFLTEKTTFPRYQRGSNIFRGGVQLFIVWGSKC